MRFHKLENLSVGFTSLSLATDNSFSVIGTDDGRKRSGKIHDQTALVGEEHVLPLHLTILK